MLPDVTCLDQHRVVLDDGEGDDYIHASYVSPQADDRPPNVICTQGPTEETTGDFYRMIRQEQCRAIIMLCQTHEDNRVGLVLSDDIAKIYIKRTDMSLLKTKCYDYYPTATGERKRFGGFTTECEEQKNRVVVLDSGGSDDDGSTSDEEREEVVVERRLVISNFGRPHQKLQHFQYGDWPDKGVPRSSTTALFLCNLIDKLQQRCASPVIIHCSAGIGRTGTVVVLWLARRLLAAGGPVSIQQVVRRVRDQRMHSVQTDLQYLFIYRALVDDCAAKGYIHEEEKKPYRQFLRDYDALVMRKAAAGNKR